MLKLKMKRSTNIHSGQTRPTRCQLSIVSFVLNLSALSSVQGYSSQATSQKITFADSGTLKQSGTGSLVDTARMIQQRRQLMLENSEATNEYRGGLFGQQQSDSKSVGHSDNWTSDLFDGGFSFEDMHSSTSDEDSMASKIKEQHISRLQDATGSEVLESELRLQMEAASRRPTGTTISALKSSAGDTSDPLYAMALIDSHHSDASSSEKFAMKMIPTQLPVPIQQSLANRDRVAHTSSPVKNELTSQERSSSQGRKATNKSVLNSNMQRVSHEEEIKLAQIIQQGAKIHSLKADFESKHKRSISRSEWTKLARLESTSELRRLVSSYRAAKNKLVTANLGLVYAVVRQAPHLRKNEVTEEELVQEGTLGLIRAAELFDPDKGLRFSTYATIWIKGVLGNTKVHQPIVVPSREKTKWNKIQRAQADLKAGRGEGSEEPTAKEISRAIQIPEADVADLMFKMPRASKVLSLDYQYKTTTTGGGEERSNEMYGSKEFHEDGDLAETLQLKADIVATLTRNLDPREARLIRLRYGLQDGNMRTIVECAECMGLSRQRVQQLAVRCLQKLREADDSKSLQEYLLTVA